MTVASEAPRILLFGATYSRNTGDGVIADCLAWELSRRVPAASIGHVDLAGRDGVGATSVSHRALILKALKLLPAPLRRRVTRIGLERLMARLRPAWRAEIARADLALFSGGQLFSDANLNFPMKIGTVAELCREAQTPVSVVAAGASRNWSAEGRALFERLAACDLRHVGLRDAASLAAWRKQFAGGPAPILVRDPGLLAAGCYGLAPPTDPETAPVGIGVAAPVILAHHADRPVAGAGEPMSGQKLIAFFRDLSLELVRRGRRPRLFCNGAEEDVQTLRRLAREPALAHAIRAGRVELAPPPETGAQLAAEVAACRAIVAHRLHACILGYALRLPVVGLSWDSKLDAFFESVGLASNMLTEADLAPAAAADRIEAAIGAGIAPDRHATALAECRAGIAAVLAGCGFTLPGGR